MLIRSQDKTTLVTFENIVINIHNLNINNINGKEIICWSQMNPGEDEYIPLGYYSTEEKAMKVLDMIQEAYSENETLKTISTGALTTILTKNYETPEDVDFNTEMLKNHTKIMEKSEVFQMPADSEVEV